MNVDMIIKTTLAVGAVIGMVFGGVHALDVRYTPLTSYQAHLDAEQSRYVLELKKAIRELQARLREHPDPYLEGELEDTIATLCEIRPEDKLCR